MESSNMTASRSSHALRGAALVATALPLFLTASCNGGSGGGGMIGSVGAELTKPDGSTFFNEKNSGGNGSTLKLLDVSWGRLVDVHDIDASTGDPDPTPLFRDFVINETVQSDGQTFLLETNPVTQKTRLVILREDTEDPLDDFSLLLKQAGSDLSPIQPKSDAVGTLPPFSFIARNAALVLRFDDLLDDGAAAQLTLPNDVTVLTGYAPNLPYQNKRVIFDPNFGGLQEGGKFHSTRVIVDLTVSEAEAASMPVPTGLNSLGLPASLTTTQSPNVSLRIPTKGEFSKLTNLSNAGLSTTGNGPIDFGSETLDVVRAMRAGNPEDENNGFLLDLNAPELLSGWPITVTSAGDDPAGSTGFDFLLDITFTSNCRAQPQTGNIIELPGLFVEVTAPGLPPDAQGVVAGLKVRSLLDNAIPGTNLLGTALFKRTYDGGLLPDSLQACWLSFTPTPGVFPATAINPNSAVLLRFSEPMDPLTVTSFDSFRVQTTDDVNVEPSQIVVGDVNPSPDLKEFTFTPLLPFNHTLGSPEGYFVHLLQDGGITDLAGNAPPELPDNIAFSLDPNAATALSGGITLSFDELDELKHPELENPPATILWTNWRGQFLYDIERQLYKPRSVVRSSAIADRSQAVPGLMIPFGPGVQTPLAPLGSKLMSVWRYCDVGFSGEDETNYNVDVEGLSWSPVGGQAVSDFYPKFEMRLSHSHYLPDEALDANLLPDFPASGLSTDSYVKNVLVDPVSPQKVVHPAGLGYVLNPVDVFLTPTGTAMMPYPFNRLTDPDEDIYYTWRDTAIQAKAGPMGAGMDLQIMEDAGLGVDAGSLALQNQVPSIGLPLLMEFRTYPSVEGVGLNSFDISLAINTSRLPAFRIFSTGGTNTLGTVVTKDPDLEEKPDGGFNPSSMPTPGAKTPPNDNSFYIGQMDLITRISRLHSVWFDTGQGGSVTDFLDPVVQPSPEEQPTGTQLVFAFRGATAIANLSSGVGTGYAFRAEYLDPYGDVRNAIGATITFMGLSTDVTYFPSGDKTWKSDIDQLDTARYFQVRATFVGNTTTLLSPEFSGLGVAWQINN